MDTGKRVVRLRAATKGASDPSVAIWSAQRNSDLLARAIGKPVEVEGPEERTRAS